METQYILDDFYGIFNVVRYGVYEAPSRVFVFSILRMDALQDDD